MFNSLYTKLVLVLFLLCLIMGTVFLTAVLYTAPMYQQEVSQQLNHNLASYIVKEHVLIQHGQVRRDNLEVLFHKAMIINPSLELYLLNADGKVIAHSMPSEKVKNKQVSLQPIHQFLSASDDGLIMGDDPAKIDLQNSFSVAPIDFEGQRQGYIYAILGSEKIGYISEVLKQSLIMKWSAGVVLAALILAFLAGLIMFFFLMRKLRGLSQSMQKFKANNLTDKVSQLTDQRPVHDEIESMALTFEQMSSQIHTQMHRLQETDALRRQLVANVSHDLRTPLSSLGGYLETLVIKSKELSEDDKQNYLRIAHKNSQRLSLLVEELFELAKLDANEIKPHQETFSLAELVSDISAKFQLRARDKNIHLDVQINGIHAYITADVGMIERVLDNLIDNSLKNTPSQGQVRIKLSNGQNKVTVSVSDSGYGIDEKELPLIFTRFYRKPSTEKNGSESTGLGLGLAIASRIVELHGSSLTVDSILHQGTTFEFSLPLAA